jgi:OmpA-OmpF porin, OOP family
MLFAGLYPFPKRTILKKAFVGLMAVFAVSASHADPYVAASLGSSKLDDDCAGTIACDTRSTGLKVLGGYKFTPNFAIEGGYLDFGKAKATLANGVPFTLKVNGLGVGAAFHQDLNQDWNLVGRLGVASLKAEVGVPGGSAEDTNAQLYGGLGVGYRITPKMSIDASYDFSKAEFRGGKSNVNMLGVGLTVSF